MPDYERSPSHRWPCPKCGAPSLGRIERGPQGFGRRCRSCGDFLLAAFLGPAGTAPAPPAPRELLGPWRTLAEKFVAALLDEERQLGLDARRAQERGLGAFARALEELRSRVGRMRGDTLALVKATAHESHPERSRR